MNVNNQEASSTSQTVSQTAILDYNDSFLATYKPSMKKVLITNFFLIFPIVTLPIVVVNVIKAMYTSFVVGQKSIDFKFEFLTTKLNSFSVDRITQIILKESLLDKWIGTCSVFFYSIGSQTPIVFKDIKKTDDMYENLLSKVGIYKKVSPQEFTTTFSMVEYLKSNIWGTLVA